VTKLQSYNLIRNKYFNKYGFISILKDNWIKTTTEFFIVGNGLVKDDLRWFYHDINEWLLVDDYLLRRPYGTDEVEQWDDYVCLFAQSILGSKYNRRNYYLYRILKSRNFNIDQRDKTTWSLWRKIKEKFRTTLLPFQTALLALCIGKKLGVMQDLHLSLTLFLDTFKDENQTSGRLIMYLVMQNNPDHFKSWNKAMIKKYGCENWYQKAFAIYYSDRKDLVENIINIMG